APSPQADGRRVPPHAPRRHPPARVPLDRRVPVLARPSAHRHDRPLPRAQAPRRRPRTAAAHRLHGAPHRPHDELPRRAGPQGLDRGMRRLRILVLTHPDLAPPDVLSSLSPKETFELKTEIDVITTLRKLGHDVHV